MLATLRVPALAIFVSIVLAGCSGTDNLFNTSSSSDVTTSSLTQNQAQKVDPACGSLALEIDTLRREGVADKIEKAAAKKYKMTPADLGKANQLNKANADFQAKCSTLPRSAAMPAQTGSLPVPPAKSAVGAPAVASAGAR
jgi:hypothetical protein